MSARRVVVVESPAKAEAIGRYLEGVEGGGWRVVASYGHVRDLLPKDGSVRPEEDFALSWHSDGRGEERIRAVARMLDEAGDGAELWLATDPDREGEAISWHLAEELRRRGKPGARDPRRVTFNEITPDAVRAAFRSPRELDRRLIDAYLARRALDYLYGFTLSPILWRKLPGSRSAGRVQSVALRLVCEREKEIARFAPTPYWEVEARLRRPGGGEPFAARPSEFRGGKVPARGFDSEEDARAAAAALEAARDFRVDEVEAREERRRPRPPFITSTLQQEASGRLGFGATRTMRVAQDLYEDGLITYMRTDGAYMAPSAVREVRAAIAERLGDEFVPAKPVAHRTRAKKAQEAHEAIRPTDPRLGPEAEVGGGERAALYALIWRRAMASQAADARIERVRAAISAEGFEGSLRASGATVRFPGWLALRGESAGGDGEAALPPLAEGDGLEPARGPEGEAPFSCERRETRPPGRFTEASLVKRLEELGIGRPSTYAAILQTLRDRGYAEVKGKAFRPHERGWMVSAFLEEFFPDQVEYDFTAGLEDELDRISEGEAEWKETLGRFWREFSARAEGVEGLKISDVIDALDRELGHLFLTADPERPDGDPRECPSCGGRLGIKLGRTGGFIGCGNYPECRHTRPLAGGGAGGGDRELGAHPETGLPVRLRSGPFGPYVQEGETPPAAKAKAKGKAAGGKAAPAAAKPRRSSLSPACDPEAMTLERAVALLALPRVLGEHEGQAVSAGIGRYGPWVRRGRTYASVPKDEDVLEMGLNRAVALVAEKEKKRGGGAGALRELGEPEGGGGAITVHEGRWGAYVKRGRLNATLPAGASPESITLEEAVALLAARAAKGKAGAGRKAAGKTAAKRKAPAKRAAGKTAAKRKAPAKAKAGGRRPPAGG